nr:carboxylesterase family protein [Nocardia testacea]
MAEGHSRHSPTYAYRYDFAPRLLQLYKMGATHATDLLATFGSVYEPWSRALTAGGSRRGLLAVTRQVQNNWLHFARTGEPLPSWPRYTEEERSTLIIDAPGRVDHDPDSARRKLWAGVRAPQLVPSGVGTAGTTVRSGDAEAGAEGEGTLLDAVAADHPIAATAADAVARVVDEVSDGAGDPAPEDAEADPKRTD